MHMQENRQIKQIVGSNIRARRDELGFSRRELATRIDVDQTQIFKWERGDHLPHEETLAALAQELGRDISWFFVDRFKNWVGDSELPVEDQVAGGTAQ